MNLGSENETERTEGNVGKSATKAVNYADCPTTPVYATDFLGGSAVRFYVLKTKFSWEGPAVTNFLHSENSKLGRGATLSYVRDVCWHASAFATCSWGIRGLGRYGDVAFSTGDKILVTEHFLALYQNSGLKGLIEVAPAQITDWMSVDGYFDPEMEAFRKIDSRTLIQCTS